MSKQVAATLHHHHLLLLFILLALIGSSLSAAAPGQPADLLAQIRHINSYLEQQTGGKQADTATIELELREAVETINSLLVGGASLNSVDQRRFGGLLGGSSEAGELLPLLRELQRFIDRCEQEALELFIQILDSASALSPTDSLLGPLYLQQVVAEQLRLCWRSFVGRIPARLENVLGKMSHPVFDFVELLAQQVDERLHPRLPRSRGTIRIDDGARAEQRDPEKVLRRLRALQFDAKGRELVALSLNSLFNQAMNGSSALLEAPRKLRLMTLYTMELAKPCNELVARFEAVCSNAAIFRRHINETLGMALLSGPERPKSATLDYHLAVYRICRSVDEDLWKELAEVC